MMLYSSFEYTVLISACCNFLFYCSMHLLNKGFVVLGEDICHAISWPVASAVHILL